MGYAIVENTKIAILYKKSLNSNLFVIIFVCLGYERVFLEYRKMIVVRLWLRLRVTRAGRARFLWTGRSRQKSFR